MKTTVLEDLQLYLHSGEITPEQYSDATYIDFRINFEDLGLFINNIDIPLTEILLVEYSSIESKYDGCYKIRLVDDGDVYYGWYDSDPTAKLYKLTKKEVRNGLLI